MPAGADVPTLPQRAREGWGNRDWELQCGKGGATRNGKKSLRLFPAHFQLLLSFHRANAMLSLPSGILSQ